MDAPSLGLKVFFFLFTVHCLVLIRMITGSMDSKRGCILFKLQRSSHSNELSGRSVLTDSVQFDLLGKDTQVNTVILLSLIIQYLLYFHILDLTSTGFNRF